MTHHPSRHPFGSSTSLSPRAPWREMTLAALLAGLAACSAVPVLREDAAELDSRPGARSRTQLEPYYYDYATADSDAGDVGLTRKGLKASHTFGRSGNWSLEMSGTAERARYSIPGLGAALPTAPGASVSDLETYQFEVNAAYDRSDRVTHVLYGALTASGESGTDPADAVRGALLLANRYAINSRLGFLVGLAAFSRLEGDTLASPIFGLDWKPHEQWELVVGLPETSLTYAASERLRLALSLGFQFNDYRLDQPGSLDGGVLASEIVTLALSTEWTLSDSATASLIVGQPLFNELEFLDASGNTEFETSIDHEPFLGFQVNLSL